jgi:hypothetical protein
VSRAVGPALVALLGLVVAPAAAHATTETASLGATSATFTYEKTGDFTYTGMKLTVTRAGAVAFDGVATTPECEDPYCAPAGVVSGSSLKVADLDGDGEPEVLVDLYTGGAHCCTVTEILRWNGTAYRTATRNFADFGYTLDAGTFVTGDPRFAYAFASFADSAFPVRLLTFGAAGWRDVTRAHRATLTADAARWLKEYRKRRSGTVALGVLAAWVADEDRLGATARAKADRYLTAELRAGRLKAEQGWPHGKTYISMLRRRLKAWGYR